MDPLVEYKKKKKESTSLPDLAIPDISALDIDLSDLGDAGGLMD